MAENEKERRHSNRSNRREWRQVKVARREKSWGRKGALSIDQIGVNISAGTHASKPIRS